MVIVLFLAVSIFIIISIVHGRSHFRLNLCSYTNRQLKCKCKGVIPVDSDFNFFPKSWHQYTVFNIVLCCVMIIMEISMTAHPKSVSHLLLGYYSTPNGKNSLQLTKSHWINITKSYAIIVNNKFEYILIYGFMILLIWESLFSYYRWYTTYKTIKLLDFSSIDVFKRFTIYAIMFCIFFIATIHFYYLLFPIIIFSYFHFNVYCNYKFASVLISQYKLFQKLSDEKIGSMYNENELMIINLHFLRNTSIICCIIQTISLSIFIITYDINILYLLPILWCISSSIYSINFVRNKTYLKQKLKCIRKNKEIETKSQLTMAVQSTRTIQNNNNNEINISKPNQPQIEQKPAVIMIPDDDLLDALSPSPMQIELPSTNTKIYTSRSENAIRIKSKMNTTKHISTPHSMMLRTRKQSNSNSELDIPILFEEESAAIDERALNEKRMQKQNNKISNTVMQKCVSAPVVEGKSNITNGSKKRRKLECIPSNSEISGDNEIDSNLPIPKTIGKRSRSSPDIDAYFKADITGTIRSLESLRLFGF